MVPVWHLHVPVAIDLAWLYARVYTPAVVSLSELSFCVGKPEPLCWLVQGREEVGRWSLRDMVSSLTCQDSKNVFPMRVKDHTRTPELQILYTGCVSGRVAVVFATRNCNLTLSIQYTWKASISTHVLCSILICVIWLTFNSIWGASPKALQYCFSVHAAYTAFLFATLVVFQSVAETIS